MFIFQQKGYSMASMFTTPKDKIIVALDVSTGEEAEKLIQQLTPYVGFFKVGLELTTAIGVPIGTIGSNQLEFNAYCRHHTSDNFRSFYC